MDVRKFIEEHYKHFNAGEIARCTESLQGFLGQGGRLMITLAGAMSTAEIGRSLAPAIREQRVHAICCTGANLEEDLFSLVARSEYETITEWREMSSNDDAALRDRGMNRVTDVAIPETAIGTIEESLMELWEEAEAVGDSRFPHEYFYDLLLHGELEFGSNPRFSWLMAAADANLPIFTPGWEDSTLGSLLAARVLDCTLKGSEIVKSGLQAMQSLADWYREDDSPTGILQIGGGIAGDFAISVVPMLRQDAKIEVPLWSWFAQISESRPSYGGYSGAPPNEKISWGKLGVDTPRFVIESDATIVLPLLLSALE
ncbi:MAG: deoxyhypusine synthase family protein [Candidatus Thalassarchaeaceae archaeon]|nr:deoxyhypusine synthase family protein [Candidatus Thalassarchaeaceae archaeon]MDP6703270.1 deoxyhypusine synthase family protein [Candidatus Thalassarchaeaceae archaeon]MDP7004041.1 deoxyhypusine synthase family protein [Candidatus Thalassarchaeaceae archaeon]